MSKALVIVGHGSSRNPHSCEPILDAASEIKRRGHYDEVGVGFLKQAPFINECLNTIQSEEIVIVPFFISNGYYTQKVVPRDLGLVSTFTERSGKKITYCQPLGRDPLFAEIIIQRAREIAALKVGRPLDEITLAILGHGTSQNPVSEKNIFLQAERVVEQQLFSDVHTVFIDQEPLIDSIFDAAQSDTIIMVPLFVANGWHVSQTIPEEMGMKDGVLERDGKQLFYADATGTDPGVTDLILKMATASPKCMSPCSENCGNCIYNPLVYKCDF